MCRPLFLLLFCFVFISSLSAQVKPKGEGKLKFGISEENLIQQLMITVPGVGSNAREMLNQQSVKPNMMPVRKAGQEGHEISYALASCLEYYVNMGNNYKDNLSPDYISLCLKNQGKAIAPKEAFLFLAESGTVSAAILPYGSQKLTSAVYATQSYKLRNYLHIFREVTRERQKVYEVRKALMRGNPVLIELQAGESIQTQTGKKYLEIDKSGGQVYPLVVVGYDETFEAFELRSSWGSDWGNNGYIWIEYDDFGKYAQNGYVMVPDVEF